MFVKTKKQIADLLETISEMALILPQLTSTKDQFEDCKAALQLIENQLKSEGIQPVKTINKLYVVMEVIDSYYNSQLKIGDELASSLFNEVIHLKQLFLKEIKPKLNIAFLPYKASMWDSMETVYEAAVKDEDCVAHVIPIPYYRLAHEQAIETYEGDRFPQNIPIVHFSQYVLEDQQPDIIFVHNIYDGHNTLTRVYEEYFTENLKKHTEMLVYLPYHVSSFTNSNDHYAYALDTVKNVDKVVLAGDYLKAGALKSGVPEEKILVLGSPKLDAMVKALAANTPPPIEWEKTIKDKIVFLVNTGCFHFARNPWVSVENLINIFSIPRFVKNSAVIWRPHPLTEVSIANYNPSLLEFYQYWKKQIIGGENGFYEGVIFDDSDDYIPALKTADVLISSNGSLLRSYLLTEKKVIYWGEHLSENAIIPRDAFYYPLSAEGSWFDLIKKFPDGYDPLAPKRKGLAGKVYTNIDGTAGEKIHKAIKHSVFRTLEEGNYSD